MSIKGQKYKGRGHRLEEAQLLKQLAHVRHLPVDVFPDAEVSHPVCNLQSHLKDSL